MHDKIAVITTNLLIADEIKLALKTLYDVQVYKSSLALHYAMEQKIDFRAIITDDELTGENGIFLRKTLVTLGYIQIPFVILLDKIKNSDRLFAMKEGVSEIFSKPINKNDLIVRLPYLIDNYTCINMVNTAAVGYKLPLTKRIFDVLFSGLTLIIFSPIFLIIAIMVKGYSKGPIFIFSLRVGSGYSVFKLYRFRYKYAETKKNINEFGAPNNYVAESLSTITQGGLVRDLCNDCALAGSACLNPLFEDKRINCGKLYLQRKENKPGVSLIDRYKKPADITGWSLIQTIILDKMPQMWNVFIGDISMVGNRPLPLHEAEKITTDKYAQRFLAPAGFTGLWHRTKNGKNKITENDKLALDNDYAIAHSFKNDVIIILKNLPALFEAAKD